MIKLNDIKKAVFQITNKKWKKVVLAVFSVTAIGSMLVLLGLKVFVSMSFSDRELHALVTQFFNKNFNKAVTCNEVTVDSFGTIIIDDLAVSEKNDFNDNINLLKSKKTVITLSFMDFLRRKIIITNILFDRCTITVQKRFGKGYRENFEEIFSSCKPINRIEGVDHDRFRIDFQGSHIAYIEYFRENQIAINFRNLNGYVKSGSNRLSYRISSKIDPQQSKEGKTGALKLEGHLAFDANNRIIDSTGVMALDDFDLSALNGHVAQYGMEGYFVQGYLSARISLSSKKSDLIADALFELNNLGIERDYQKPNTGSLVLNENLTCRFRLRTLEDMTRIIVDKASIVDDALKLVFDASVVLKDKKEESATLRFRSNTIDLGRLSFNVIPGKELNYSGFLSLDGNLSYDFIKKRLAEKSAVNISLEKFLLEKGISGKKNYLVRDLNLRLMLNGALFSYDMMLSAGKTDLSLKGKTVVKQWSPFVSETDCLAYSNSVEMNLIADGLMSGIDFLYRTAYSDSSKSEEDINYVQTPHGILLNNNGISIRYRATKMAIAGNCYLSDLGFTAILRGGHAWIENFTLGGYDGSYACRADCYFSWFHPRIDISASIKNFDLSTFNRDCGFAGEMSGLFSGSFNYGCSTFRPAHMIINSLTQFNASISGGALKSTDLINRLYPFLKQVNKDIPDFRTLAVEQASFSFSQIGDNYHVRDLSVKSNLLQIKSTGTYSYTKGFNVPVVFVFEERDDKNAVLKSTMVPASLTGPLTRPSLTVEMVNNGKKMIDSLMLFKIN